MRKIYYDNLVGELWQKIEKLSAINNELKERTSFLSSKLREIATEMISLRSDLDKVSSLDDYTTELRKHLNQKTNEINDFYNEDEAYHEEEDIATKKPYEESNSNEKSNGKLTENDIEDIARVHAQELNNLKEQHRKGLEKIREQHKDIATEVGEISESVRETLNKTNVNAKRALIRYKLEALLKKAESSLKSLESI